MAVGDEGGGVGVLGARAGGGGFGGGGGEEWWEAEIRSGDSSQMKKVRQRLGMALSRR